MLYRIAKQNNLNTQLTMHRENLLQLLDRYKTPFLEEAAMVSRTQRFIMANENCFDRSLAAGHVTGSSWVVNPSRTHALMLHHRKLNLWLQPGGHADGDTDIHNVVIKETSEESGIAIGDIKLLSSEIFDIDIHTIYANQYDPRHEHYDIRFLLEIDDNQVIPGNDESHQIGWVALDRIPQFNNFRSLYRMTRKTRQRFPST